MGVTVVRGKLSSEILCCLSGVDVVVALSPPVEPLLRWNEAARGGNRLIGVTLRAVEPDDRGND